MRVRVFKTSKTRDGVVCFTAGKIYEAREAFHIHRIDSRNTYRKSTGLVYTVDDRGEPSALMFSEFEVTV